MIEFYGEMQRMNMVAVAMHTLSGRHRHRRGRYVDVKMENWVQYL